jgi:hypothetical protein
MPCSLSIHKTLLIGHREQQGDSDGSCLADALGGHFRSAQATCSHFRLVEKSVRDFCPKSFRSSTQPDRFNAAPERTVMSWHQPDSFCAVANHEN